MGYTHYYYRKKELDPIAYLAAAEDCKRVCESELSLLAGRNGDGPPEFTSERIGFNGIDDSGCEPFRFDRVFESHYMSADEKGRFFNCTKTRHLPYDLAVMCCLIVLQRRFGDDVQVASDGESREWQPARDACQRVLGYGADFKLSRDEETATA